MNSIRDEERLHQLIHSGVSLVSSKDAAIILGLKPNTLRVWACKGRGDLKPIFTQKGARWRLSDIRDLIGV